MAASEVAEVEVAVAVALVVAERAADRAVAAAATGRTGVGVSAAHWRAMGSKWDAPGQEPGVAVPAVQVMKA